MSERVRLCVTHGTFYLGAGSTDPGKVLEYCLIYPLQWLCTNLVLYPGFIVRKSLDEIVMML